MPYMAETKLEETGGKWKLFAFAQNIATWYADIEMRMPPVCGTCIHRVCIASRSKYVWESCRFGDVWKWGIYHQL